MLLSVLYMFGAIGVALALVFVLGVIGLVVGTFGGLILAIHFDPKGLGR